MGQRFYTKSCVARDITIIKASKVFPYYSHYSYRYDEVRGVIMMEQYCRSEREFDEMFIPIED